MNNSRSSFVWMSLMVLVTSLILGCSPKVAAQKGGSTEDMNLDEDLKKYRVQYPRKTDTIPLALKQEAVQNAPVSDPNDISDKLVVVLDTIASRNYESGYMQGYTIMVYSGTSERDAGRVRNRLYDIVPDMEGKIQYVLPTYFVKIGKFHQQVEAQPLYMKIRNYYPGATIVPEKFPILKYESPE